jgi:hypothetical protein
MPSIQLDGNGEVISEDFSGETTTYTQGEGVTTSPSSIGDPNAPADYSDAELEAALPFTRGAGSPEQAELDGMRSRVQYCLDKANKISGYAADGTPRYEVGDLERASLLRTAKGLQGGLELQLLMSNRNIARRYLNDQKKITDAQATLAHHKALEVKAREIAFNREAEELASLMIKRNLGGQRK